MFCVRKASKDDIAVIVAIDQKSFPLSIAFTTSRVAYQVKNNLVLCAVNASDEVCGYVCYSSLTSTRKRRIYSIATDPKYRGKGIASLLMTEGEAQSKARLIYLEVDETNHAAIALYLKLGYEKFGIYHKYYGKTSAIRMRKLVKKSVQRA